ncbi:MAG: UbiX family flavin prenyltransferase [Planctomycetes bacterium]|nr:UbiX family flavin prenyltransferase [Planctomycetota bacterium]
MEDRFFVGITGASGVIYGVRVVRALAILGYFVEVAITDAGYRVLQIELGMRIDPATRDAGALAGDAPVSRIRIFNNRSIDAGAASGTYPLRGVIVVPCSMGTLGRIANGYASCLIERVADVALKESRPLVVVPRETPLSKIHLDHCNRLAWAGARIVPAMPAFYHLPKTIDDLVDHLAGKILDAAGVEHNISKRWGVLSKPPGDPGPRPDLEDDAAPGNLAPGDLAPHDGEGCDS